jgi:rare lipoprotein A
MKQITRLLIASLSLSAFTAIQAQDITGSAADSFRGQGGYAGSPSFTGVSPEYIPAPQAGLGTSAFREEGIASWYGTEFEGRPTASGELFNPALLTAAHPSLPFGTMLRVTNTQNQRQVTVRVNDRGPFVNTRIIDVSRAAAEALDILATGTAPVVVELAGETPAAPAPAPWIAPIPASTIPSANVSPPAVSGLGSATSGLGSATSGPGSTASGLGSATPGLGPAMIKPGIPPLGTTKRYRVQVGSYKVTRNAVDSFDRVKNMGLEPAYERYEDYYRVVLSGVRAEDIQGLANRLGPAGYQEIFVWEN